MKPEKQYIFYDLAFAAKHPELTAIELLVYCRIKGYADKYGQYNLPLADLAACVHSSADTVRRALHKLIELGLLAETKENGKATAYQPLANCYPLQIATPCKLQAPPSQIATPHIINNNKQNIERDNNAHARESEKTETAAQPKTKKFQKPTAAEVQAYCDERNNGISGEEFCDFYESKGWVIGKAPMKDWRAAVRTWEQKHKKAAIYGGSKQTQYGKPTTNYANPADVYAAVMADDTIQ